MTEIKQKFIGESKLIEAVRKKLTLRLGDKVVKPKHLSDEISSEVIQPQIDATVLPKERDLYLAIASVVAGDVALKQGLGDSEVYGISQKVLTEYITELNNFDENQEEINANQEEVNTQVGVELSNRYTKDETYSAEQLDHMITTPNPEYISVDTYAELIAIEEHPDGAIYRVANYDGVSVDTTKFAEYTWTGSEYKLMAVRGNTLEPLVGYVTCTTAEGTQNKEVTIPNYLLTIGGSIKIKMSNKTSNSSTKLKINSLTPISLFYNGVQADASNTWSKDEILEVYYDGTQFQATNILGNDEGFKDTVLLKSVIFDFSTGSVAQWTNRSNDFRFYKNHWYRVEALTTDTSTRNYFSVRSSAGTSLIPNIEGSGYRTGARVIEFLCTVDGGTQLYMSYADDGAAIAYNVEISDITAEKLNSDTSLQRNIINDIDWALNRKEEVIANPFTFSKTGNFIKTDGTIGTSTSWYMSNIVHLQAGQMVILTSVRATVSYATMIALTDEEGTYYKPVVFSDNVLRTLTYTMPEDGYIVCQYTVNTGEVLVINDSQRINDIEKALGGKVDKPEAYLEAEQQRVYRLLFPKMMKQVAFVVFNTDQHFMIKNPTTAQNNPKWVFNGLSSLVNISKLIPLDVIVLGGDVAGYGTGYSTTDIGILDSLNAVNAAMADINTMVVAIPGNHDAKQNANTPAAMMYNAVARKNKWNDIYKQTGIDNCDAYIDDEKNQIRYIFVDTFTRNGRTESYATFLANTLSTLPENYDALIFSHNPLTNEFAGVVKRSTPTGTESDAFYQPTDLKATLNTYADRIIACICGHSHADVYAYNSQGILFIETTCACAHNKMVFDDIPYVNTLESATETAFDFFVIDKEEKTIEAIRYGQGTNRLWKYKGTGAGLISYKNCLSGSTNVPSVILMFTDTNQNTINVPVDTDGTFEVYLELGETYFIGCDGYTPDIDEITITENMSISITLT